MCVEQNARTTTEENCQHRNTNLETIRFAVSNAILAGLENKYGLKKQGVVARGLKWAACLIENGVQRGRWTLYIRHIGPKLQTVR